MRTKSWTPQGVREGVRMHSKEEVCLYLLAREDGMRRSEAAAFAGVSAAARHWDEVNLPRFR